jgi:hypothetical protein
MPEDMRPTSRRLDTGSPQSRTSDMADSLPGLPHGERLEGGDRAQENELALNPRSSRSHVLEEDIADILRQRKPDFATSLSRYSDRGRLEAEIREAQLRHVTGTEPEADQEQQSRSIPKALRSWRTSGEHPSHLLRSQTLWKRLLRPVGGRRQRMLEARPALALDSQVTQKHANCSQNHSQGGAPVVPVPRLYKVPEAAGCIRLRIVPKNADEIPDIASVRGQRGLDDPPMDLHPLKEILDQSNRLGTSLHALCDSPLPEMLEESSDTREHLAGAIP